MLYVLLSPAKKLDFSPGSQPAPSTAPVHLKDTAILAERAKKLSAGDLRRLMHLSPKLADLNHARFEAFDLKNRTNTKPAIFTFSGDVYIGLDAKTLTDDDIAFAQKHLGILSGLYGVLRPLDAIQAYRLEMGTAFKTDRGKNLHEFWNAPLTKAINSTLARMKAPTLINLASDEYFNAIDADKLKAPVIQPVFKEIKNGKAMALSFFFKKARGMMARYIIQNRIDDPERLKAFDGGGYKFDAKTSSTTRWTFTRKAK
ncbi:MAG: peroxide stress protein YaaA [Rhodobacteraceae bacterium]|nr:peroxide stress protein YaaA [Paracoccaceae bacterium]